MKDQELYQSLVDSLPILAKVTGGYATVVDKDGVRLKTVDSSGTDLAHLRGVVFELAKQSADTGKTISGMSQLEHGAVSWCMPIGDYVLCCSNVEIMKRDNKLEQALSDSLPFIARVAGGEAVIFNDLGKRTYLVDSKGTVKKEALNIVSDAAKQCMRTQKPVVGESTLINGAMAVRIPITKTFGFGFNNEDTVLRNQKLMNVVRKYKFAKYDFSDIIGESLRMKKIKEVAMLAARSNSNVLICGETGTGKELLTQAIHNASDRCNKPFVAINCSALPPTLIESSLFGYESGAFTGAKRRGSSGVFEQANEGTLFLDEISEMEYTLQAKLLRVLQEREVIRIGGNKVIPLNIRVIASTNKPLDVMVKKGTFRQDLFFRLNVMEIQMPPLRHIREDIPLITDHAIKKMNLVFGKFVRGVESSALESFMEYDWPGNIRELFNCIESAFNIIGADQYVRKEHLTLKLRGEVGSDEVTAMGLSERTSIYEKKVVEKALKDAQGIRADAAKRLKISTTTLWRKIRDLNIECEW